MIRVYRYIAFYQLRRRFDEAVNDRRHNERFTLRDSMYDILFGGSRLITVIKSPQNKRRCPHREQRE